MITTKTHRDEINKMSNEELADEMFKKMGYERIYTNSSASEDELLIGYKNHLVSINFWGDKEVEARYVDSPYMLDMNELKAINKKCEELGWYD